MTRPMTLQQQLESALSHHRAARLTDAERIYRQILAIDPNHVDALNLLGALSGQLGRQETALELIGRAIKLKPDLMIAHSNLGNILRDLGRFEEAVAAIQEAIRLQSDYAVAHNNLGLVLKKMERLDEAIASYREAIRLQPDLAEAYSNLGTAILGRGEFDEAVALHREAIRLKPDYTAFNSDLVHALNYHPNFDARMIYEEHRLWGERHAEPLRKSVPPLINSRDPDRNLRIGYVSADFRQHSVGHFFISLLEHHNRGPFEIFCFANMQSLDAMSERMKRSCDVWRNIFGVSDEDVAQMVRADGIDILVDLSGHSAGNRLGVFGRKPAPIQVTYLGYANTTGMKAIDYRFTDALADPPGMTDHLNAETLWRLPACAWCFQPPESAPVVQPRRDGPITFGCFNAFLKVNPKIMAVWAELLKRLPGSHLLLKSTGTGDTVSRQRITSQFAEYGVPGEQIEIFGWAKNSRQHLEYYHQVDIALDPFPYHGTTTTCEALWMGVPVVTMAGQTHVSRVGVSLLSNVGLAELIARSAEEYVSIAADLAGDLPRLAELRRTLRSRMQASPLMDFSGFAHNVEAAYRQMWRNWCGEHGSDRPTLQQQFESAWSHHRAGRLAEAEMLYGQILSQEPDNVRALHLLGILNARRGESQWAMELFGRAIAVDPNVAKYHTNLGAVLLESGRFDEAMESFRKALSLSPDAVDAAVGLGNALRAAGRAEEAGAAYRQAMAIVQRDADASNMLGIVLKGAGQMEESLAAFRQALAIRPNFPEALANVAAVLAEMSERRG
jgi:predicted O-linked N-acetylglucosamine transferase (SPINDLY family)